MKAIAGLSRVFVMVAVVLPMVLVGGHHSASAAELGELVEYQLTFPVDGDHHFRDWFWSRRSGGIHHAQDIMADKMTPVLAVADGSQAEVQSLRLLT